MKTSLIKITAQILLVISIMLAVSSIFVRYVILNETTYLNIFNESGTYSQIKDSVYQKIDSLLSSKNINVDIKESIVTEEDIEREVESAVYGVLEYFKTGENNVKSPDTSIYKQRISDILDSVISSVIKPASNEVSFNDNFYTKNMVSTTSKLQLNEMNYVKKASEDGQDVVKVEKLMSKEEAEARVREILKQKGLTEEQAIEKARKKGITEEQALKILAGYGITIDGYEPGGGSAASSTKEGNSTNSDSSNSQSVTGNSNGGEQGNAASSNNENQSTTSKAENNTNFKSKLDSVKNKLVDEAGKSIDKEVEKMNFNKIMESSKVQKLAKITSTLYKLFWLFILIPMIIMAILIKINVKGLNSSLKYIGTAFLISGFILVVVSSSIYMLKIYENINISQVYIKDAISNIARHCLIVLAKYDAITLVIGLFAFIPTFKKRLIK
ncbi:hypothetical protein [Clostridium chromiireducens]|uniref:Uncharacterized protein n=1 Tax=Clostridium chromiireducens TaxID=225345 RepID=A0A1V4IPM4_9CLOT|nr:hypothetical protein [Clostridium chromiireducens]OPJ61866.1 hypothetical protein CLCHR_22710 [Clostridium chromiireducens]